MKNIKLMIISIVLLIASGCSVDYKLNINDDLSINEEATIEETESYFDTNYTYYYRNEVIDTLWNRWIPSYKDAGYEYIYNSNQTGVIATSNYKNIDEYLQKSTIYTQYFDELKIEKNNNIISIETDGFKPYNEQDFERFAINDLKITIEIPFKIKENNADEKNNNKYTWYINEDTKDKKIKISFDSTKMNKNVSIQFVDYLGIFGIIIVVVGLIYYIIYRIKTSDNDI